MRSPWASGQLPLPLTLAEHARFDGFLAEGNEEAVQRLRELAAAPRPPGVLLSGPAGSGKTHLLQAACHDAARAAYLPLAELPADAQLLEGLASRRLVALDDVDRWLGTASLEAALVALAQDLRVTGGALLLASRETAAAQTATLPDWGSRLRGLVSYRLSPLRDGQLGTFVDLAVRRRGLTLDAAVRDYWLARRPRRVTAILDDLDRVDRAALAAGRRLTVPLLKAVLDL